MSKPRKNSKLTEQQLQSLERPSYNRRTDIDNVLDARAADEIRELRERLEKVKSLAIAGSKGSSRIKADNARLREALEKCGEHRHPCPKWSRHARSEDKCTCGLDAALKEPDGSQDDAT